MQLVQFRLNVKITTECILGTLQGLGRDLVARFHKQDAIICAVARNPDGLAKLKAEFPNIQTICVDLADWDKTRAALRECGPIDYLVNNAGVVRPAMFMTTTEEDIDM